MLSMSVVVKNGGVFDELGDLMDAILSGGHFLDRFWTVFGHRKDSGKIRFLVTCWTFE